MTLDLSSYKIVMNDKALLIIISYNQLEYTRQCIESIRKNTIYPHQILIVDNCSNQETVAYLNFLKNQDIVEVIFNKENQGWIGGVNQGLAYRDSPYYCVMNNDIVVYPGWLKEMVSIAEKEKNIGLVNPEWEVSKKYKKSYQDFFEEKIFPEKGLYIETDWMRGFCFLIKQSVVQHIGGLDKVYGAGYYDDWDYSVRAIQAGYKCVRARGAFVYHCKNITFAGLLKKFEYDENFNRNKALFYNRWGRPLRVLVIYTEDLMLHKENVLEIVHTLLKEQDNIFFSRTFDEPLITHTNCIQKIISSSMIPWNIWGSFINNRRRAVRKRYNVVLCSENVAKKVKRFSWLTDQYAILSLDKCPQKELLEKIRNLKQYR